MRVIAVTGYKRSGKSTVASYIEQVYGIKQKMLAEPIKGVGRYLFDWDDDYIEGKCKETLDTRVGVTPRRFMQLFGTEIMQHYMCKKFPLFKTLIGRTFWCRWFTIHNKEDTVVLADLRFPHEVTYFKANTDDTIVIRVDRLVKRNLLQSIKFFFRHSSEKALDKIKPDYVIMNDGTIADMHHRVDNIMQQLGFKQKRKGV
jgi:hypothetical protein